MLDLRTVQMNDGAWRQHALSATAPAGAVDVKVGVLAESLRSNRPPGGAFDDAYFDDFSLTVAAAGLPGDANGDGKVDLVDLDILGQNFGLTGGGASGQGDFNGDGNVDLVDLDILGQNFGAMAATASPEPGAATVCVLAAMLAGVAPRRR